MGESVWPIFAEAGCSRSSKATLLAKGVIRKASQDLEQKLHAQAQPEPGRRGIVAAYTSRPGSAYVVSHEYPARPESRFARPESRQQIDILEEEDGDDTGSRNQLK